MAKAKTNRGTATLNGKNPGGTNGESSGGLTRRRRGKEEIKSDLLGTDPTRDYQATRYAYYGEVFVQQLPQWRIWTGRMMLSSDPIVNFSMNIRNAALMAGEVIIKAKNERVQKWVQEQWDYLWNQCRPQLVSAKKFGFAPLQTEWKMKDGLLCISGLKDFAPEDCRALETTGSKLIGMRVKGNPVYFPQALWLKFGGEFGVPYGTGCLRRSYPAWFEKWMDHGAKRLLQLRMVKDAYIGDIFWYPPDMKVELPDGTSMSYRDLVRELGENRLSGGMLSMPMKYDANHNKLTDYTPPQNVGGITHIFDWVDHCDESILRGADIPIEVVKASETGSGYSGRSVPFLVTLSVCTQELTEIVQFVNEQVLRPIAYLNWGGEPEYTMEAKSLVESFSQDTSGSPMGGEAVGGSAPQQQQVPGQPQQMSETGQARFGEVPHGHTRLYRVEPKIHGDSSWLKKHISHEQYQQHLSEKGRLFSDNLKSLEQYGHGSDTHNTYHVDVPHHVAAAAKRKPHADDFHEYLLPPEHVAKKKLLSTQHSEAHPFEKTGKDLGELYHGSNRKLKEIDPEKLQSRDHGYYGRGFYTTTPHSAAKNYGRHVTKMKLHPDAKVLHSALNAHEAPHLHKAILEHADKHWKPAAVARGKGKEHDEEISRLAHSPIAWKDAVDRYARDNHYDAIHHSPGEVVVKNYKAVQFAEYLSDTSFQENTGGEVDVDSDGGIPSNGGNFQYV